MYRLKYMTYISTNIIVANFMKNIKDIFGFCIYARPNFAKTKRGASGGFLPRPLLLRLRHPNSKKMNQPKFCGILSPENCFRKTSSALFQISSSGFSSKKVRILSRTYRQEKQWSHLTPREAYKTVLVRRKTPLFLK